MKTIASFQIDHTILPRGMYTSRVDGDVVTYDLRARRPNVEEVMTNASIHTLEHLFATYVRNTELSDNIIYFGSGRRTGFYFLTRGLTEEQAIKLTVDAFKFTADYEGEIPGTTAKECGNYRDHDLPGAKEEARMMAEVLKNWKPEDLKYPTK